jgi:AraC family transcriptional regulator
MTIAAFRPSTGVAAIDAVTFSVAQPFRPLLSAATGIGVVEQDNLGLPVGISEALLEPLPDHVLIFVVASRGQHWHTKVAGRPYDLPAPADTLFFMPAGADAFWRSRTGTSKVMHLTVGPPWLERAAEAAGITLPRGALPILPGIADPKIRWLLRRMHAALTVARPLDRLFGEQAAVLAATELVRVISDSDGVRIRRYALSPGRVARIKGFVEENLQRDIGLAELADIARLSRFHFARSFRAETGLSPHQWVMDRRCERAKRMMTDTQLTLGEIALACGFAHQAHFTNAFRKLNGIPPGRWRASAT